MRKKASAMELYCSVGDPGYLKIAATRELIGEVPVTVRLSEGILTISVVIIMINTSSEPGVGGASNAVT